MLIFFNLKDGVAVGYISIGEYTYKTSYQSFTQKPGFFPNNTVFDKILGVFNEKRRY